MTALPSSLHDTPAEIIELDTAVPSSLETSDVKVQPEGISEHVEIEEPEHARRNELDKTGLWSLGAQHFSSTWGDRIAEFVFYLYLIELFENTLVPASLFGFFTTGVGIIFSGSIGTLVDRVPKLLFVRWCILCQKLSASGVYVIFLVLFSTDLKDQAASNQGASPVVWGLFSLVVIFGCILKLSTIGISVAIERDWATCIAEGIDDRLTTLNTILRRIDLLCKLVAPLFVSLLTSTAGYRFSAAFLLGLGVVTMLFEFIWIQIVYRRLPVLAAVENQKRSEQVARREGNAEYPQERPTLNGKTKFSFQAVRKSGRRFLKNQASDWMTFIRHPIFLSSLSISCLYLTVLSFDGTMLSWLKTHSFSDPFVAGMRGMCVVAGLIGTFLAPLMERRLGLIRAGNWAVWSEVVSLLPVLLSFFVGAPKDGERSTSWNATLLFSGMAFSRIGLWAFDLCQLKELQIALADHPRRNSITALQFALQNIADLLKYVLTIILSRPSQFRWAALGSFVCVFAGALSYLMYLKRMRGHIIHSEWMESLLGKGKVS